MSVINGIDTVVAIKGKDLYTKITHTLKCRIKIKRNILFTLSEIVVGAALRSKERTHPSKLVDSKRDGL